jgi:hypothetical protein
MLCCAEQRHSTIFSKTTKIVDHSTLGPTYIMCLSAHEIDIGARPQLQHNVLDTSTSSPARDSSRSCHWPGYLLPPLHSLIQIQQANSEFLMSDWCEGATLWANWWERAVVASRWGHIPLMKYFSKGARIGVQSPAGPYRSEPDASDEPTRSLNRFVSRRPPDSNEAVPAHYISIGPNLCCRTVKRTERMSLCGW